MRPPRWARQWQRAPNDAPAARVPPHLHPHKPITLRRPAGGFFSRQLRCSLNSALRTPQSGGYNRIGAHPVLPDGEAAWRLRFNWNSARDWCAVRGPTSSALLRYRVVRQAKRPLRLNQGQGMAGQWEISHVWSGQFHIWPKGLGGMEEFYLQAHQVGA